MRRLIWIAAMLWAAPLFASDYRTGLQNLETSRTQIDQALKRMGFRDGSESQASPESKEKVSLFQVYSNLGASQIPQGKFLFGRLLNRLVVTGDGSPAVVEFDEGQGALSGLRVMGVARPASTQGRVALDFIRLLLRGGRSVPIQSTALDDSGAQGVVASVISSKALSIAGSMAGSFVSGLVSAQQSQIPNAFGFTQVEPTGRNSLLQGVAQTAADQSRHLLEEATSEKPILVVDADTPVTVFFQEAVKW